MSVVRPNYPHTQITGFVYGGNSVDSPFLSNGMRRKAEAKEMIQRLKKNVGTLLENPRT